VITVTASERAAFALFVFLRLPGDAALCWYEGAASMDFVPTDDRPSRTDPRRCTEAAEDLQMSHIQRPSTKPRGKPFERGHDPRRNTSGVRHRPSTAALYEAASDEDLTRMWVSGLGRAIGGDVRWASLICSYLDGKPLGREERGSPGEYHRIDLSEYSSDELRAFIKAVKPPEEEPQWDPMVSLELSEPPRAAP